MTVTATVVEWDLLLEVVWVGLTAGVAVTVAVSFGILGAARSAEARRAGSTPGALAFAFVSLLGFAFCLAAVAFGIFAMIQKG